MPGARCQGSVVEELPQLVFRVDLGKGHQVLAHAAGMTERNFVRVLVGDRVVIELMPRDATRARIVRRAGSSQ